MRVIQNIRWWAAHATLLESFPDLGEEGTTLRQLQLRARDYGVGLQPVRASRDGLHRLRPPFIAHLTVPSNQGHFALVYQVGRQQVSLLDGTTLETRDIPIGAFLRLWSGYALIGRGSYW